MYRKIVTESNGAWLSPVDRLINNAAECPQAAVASISPHAATLCPRQTDPWGTTASAAGMAPTLRYIHRNLPRGQCHQALEGLGPARPCRQCRRECWPGAPCICTTPLSPDGRPPRLAQWLIGERCCRSHSIWHHLAAAHPSGYPSPTLSGRK